MCLFGAYPFWVNSKKMYRCVPCGGLGGPYGTAVCASLLVALHGVSCQLQWQRTAPDMLCMRCAYLPTASVTIQCSHGPRAPGFDGSVFGAGASGSSISSVQGPKAASQVTTGAAARLLQVYSRFWVTETFKLVRNNLWYVPWKHRPIDTGTLMTVSQQQSSIPVSLQEFIASGNIVRS